MVGIPLAFQEPPEKLIASYDYLDTASGTGYQVYYGAIAPSGSIFLTEQQIYSDRVTYNAGDGTLRVIQTTEANAEATPDLNINFDIEFNLPRNIKGKVFAEIPHGWRDTGDQTTYQKVAVNVQRYDGTNTIQLASMSGSPWLASGQTGGNDIKTTISSVTGEVPLTHFKKGDKLRLNVRLMTWEAGGNTHWVFVGADPQNRITTDRDANISGAALTFVSGEPTAMRFLVPFRIDL